MKTKKYLETIQEISNHSKHKINFIKKYVEKWLYVAVNSGKAKSICFIDCMCNSGIYADGTLGTSTEVLKLFADFSKQHPDIKFNLFCNDYNPERIENIQNVFREKTDYLNCSNIEVFFETKDVNEYLQDLIKMNTYFDYNAHAFTILFLDPYNFGTVKMEYVMNFFKKYYAELLYNYFSSDINRNQNNNTATNKRKQINESMQGMIGYNEDMNYIQIKDNIIYNLCTTQIKHCFTYQFKISTNLEIYNIIFGSPQKELKGIEKIKEVLWDLFDGDPNNYRLIKSEKNEENWYAGQTTLFDDEFTIKNNLHYYSNEAIEKLKEKFAGQKVEYEEIKSYVLCYTMLRNNDIVEHVIKPMLEEGSLKKLFSIRKNNYKKARYFFENV